jgi:hypothetical protein
MALGLAGRALLRAFVAISAFLAGRFAMVAIICRCGGTNAHDQQRAAQSGCVFLCFHVLYHQFSAGFTGQEADGKPKLGVTSRWIFRLFRIQSPVQRISELTRLLRRHMFPAPHARRLQKAAITTNFLDSTVIDRGY